jgi:DNA replication and repair protein RecF
MLNGKAQQTAISTLSVFDERWVELAAELIEVRLLVLTQLEPIIAKHYQEIAPKNQITLKYQPSWIDVLPPNLTKLEIINALNLSILDVRTEELNRGVSLTGPHRDEIGFYLNELPVKGYASHGETWSLALSIKLANLTLLKESVNTKSAPILVLDDVFAELDDQRREQLMQTVAQTEQTFITAAAQVDLPSNLGGKIFRLENGVVVGG